MAGAWLRRRSFIPTRRKPRSRVAAKFSGEPVGIDVFGACAIGGHCRPRTPPFRRARRRGYSRALTGPVRHIPDPEGLLASLMRNVPGAIYRCELDADWTMHVIGDEIERISGHPAEDFLLNAKRTFASVIHPDDRAMVEREARAAVAADAPYTLEYRVLHADGGVRWVLERGMRVVDRAGNEWLDGVIFDITHRHRAEEAARAAEAAAARAAELEASRARIVEAADAARRRLERDLHDGAQQRLVGAALALRMAERRLRAVADPATAQLLAHAGAELDAGLAELRELARGIHPAILTDRGLPAALTALARRTAVPVDLEAGVDERLSPAVESALYFTVSEALTNVDRYADASHATVRLVREDGAIAVEVCDDGVGGADAARGTGLRGIADRVGALNGSVEVVSPPAGGTKLRVTIPA